MSKKRFLSIILSVVMLLSLACSALAAEQSGRYIGDSTVNGSIYQTYYQVDVLKQLGIPMATAIDMYLRQITLTGGIPFSLSLPKAPAALNADTMTDDQLHADLQVGIKEIQNGDTVDAASAFAQFREQHR